jgi:hypothetical protein
MSKRDRRALMLMVPVLILAVVAFVVLSRGPKKSPTAAIAGGGTTPGTVVTPTPQPSPSPSAKAILVFTGRDPFQPFSGAVPVSTSSPTPTTTPSVSPAGSPPATPTGGSSTTSGGHTVVLVDIFSDGTQAQVEVDGTVYTVGEGDTFAGTFTLDSISGSCASFSNGGQSFSLCETANK